MSVTFYPMAISKDRIAKAVGNGELNLANGNAMTVLQALSLETDWCGSVDINVFIAHCVQFARHNLDKLSAEVPTVVEQGNGPTIVHCGLREGYVNEKVNLLVQIAQAGKEAGATHMGWA